MPELYPKVQLGMLEIIVSGPIMLDPILGLKAQQAVVLNPDLALPMIWWGLTWAHISLS